MPSKTLVSGNDARHADFDKILHGALSESRGGLRAMMGKDREANEVAVKEYFRHWDNKKAQDETEAVRQARADDYASLTRQYYNIATDSSGCTARSTASSTQVAFLVSTNGS
ncbi:hypothetical protein J3459_006154 [Metarhizium acridum]|nr:hypothetical protein J3459_006154 [Metarhizium acridum]